MSEHENLPPGTCLKHRSGSVYRILDMRFGWAHCRLVTGDGGREPGGDCGDQWRSFDRSEWKVQR